MSAPDNNFFTHIPGTTTSRTSDNHLRSTSTCTPEACPTLQCILIKMFYLYHWAIHRFFGKTRLYLLSSPNTSYVVNLFVVWMFCILRDSTCSVFLWTFIRWIHHVANIPLPDTHLCVVTRRTFISRSRRLVWHSLEWNIYVNVFFDVLICEISGLYLIIVSCIFYY